MEHPDSEFMSSRYGKTSSGPGAVRHREASATWTLVIVLAVALIGYGAYKTWTAWRTPFVVLVPPAAKAPASAATGR